MWVEWPACMCVETKAGAMPLSLTNDLDGSGHDLCRCVRRLDVPQQASGFRTPYRRPRERYDQTGGTFVARFNGSRARLARACFVYRTREFAWDARIRSSP